MWYGKWQRNKDEKNNTGSYLHGNGVHRVSTTQQNERDKKKERRTD